MNILVCVKQVPDTTAVKIDPVTNTLIRAGVPSILNPFDGFALEMALQMKDKTGGTVTVMSMGPAQAEDVLRESLSVGADEAYLVSGREFGGSDTLATSYILSCAVKAVEEKRGEKFERHLLRQAGYRRGHRSGRPRNGRTPGLHPDHLRHRAGRL